MNLDLMQAFFAWLAGAAGAYAAVEVRIRWLRADHDRVSAELVRLDTRLTNHLTQDH